MNKDGLYTVQAVSKADGTKHNVVVGIGWDFGRFMDWWRRVKSGCLCSYVVGWDNERAFENNQLFSNIGCFRSVWQPGMSAKIQLDLNGEKYNDIEYSLEAFERFFIFKRDRPDSFGVCVTVVV